MIFSHQKKFLKLLNDFDDYYLPYPSQQKYLDELIKNGEIKTYKEYIFKSNVRLSSIEEIMSDSSRNEKLNDPFLIFYDLEEIKIKELFYLLAKTEEALRYVKECSKKYASLKSSNTHNEIRGKIDDVIKYITEISPNPKKSLVDNDPFIDLNKVPKSTISIQYLLELKKSLENMHLTKRQVYKNFLFEMYHILKNERYEQKKISKQKIFDTVNKIIVTYFDGFEDQKEFGTKTDFSKFKRRNYSYEYGTALGLDLTHS